MRRRREGLVAAREQAGFTQESLAAAIKVDRKTVGRWEGGGQIAPWLRRPLAAALGLTLPQLTELLQPLGPNGVDTTSADTAVTTGRAGVPYPASSNGLRVAICGSRAAETDGKTLDAVVPALARLVMVSGWHVNHGPVGIGIEVMTYIADHYRPADFTMTPSLFGRQNVVHGAEYALIIGGGPGTADEADLGVFMGVKVVPFPHTSGTARQFYETARVQRWMRSWMPETEFAALGNCTDADEFVMLVQHLVLKGGTSAS
jgi:DNA-binding XRE family transcriptional regulator